MNRRTLSIFLIVGILATGTHLATDVDGQQHRESGTPRAFLPKIPISSLPFTINACGHYSLTRCLTLPDGAPALSDGILINASHVTLDLNGFTITGAPGSRDGIHIASGEKNVRIHNGTVTEWDRHGIDGDGASECAFENLLLLENGQTGIRTGRHSMVTTCKANQNGSIGLEISGSSSGVSIVTRCSAIGNGTIGIFATNGCTINECVSHNNGGVGINTAASTIQGCTSTNNSTHGILAEGCVVTNCSSLGNQLDGINAGSGSMISKCVTRANSDNGVEARDHSLVISCTATASGMADFNPLSGSVLIDTHND